MRGRTLCSIAVIFFLVANVGFLAVGEPSVVVTAPPAGTVSSTNEVTVSGNATGSDGSFEQSSMADFSAGTLQDVLAVGDHLALTHVYDDFNDSSLSPAKWTVTTKGGLAATETGGQLGLGGTGTSGALWDSSVWAVSTRAVAKDLSAELAAFSGTGSGFAGTMGYYESLANYALFGAQKDPAMGANTVVVVTIVSGGNQNSYTFGDLAAGAHTFAIGLSGGTADFYMDGSLLTSKSLPSGTYHLWLFAGVRAQGDHVSATWDNAKIDYALTGELTSVPLDTLSVDPVMKRMDWNSSTPSGTAVAVQLRSSASDDMSSSTAWAPVTKGQSSGFSAVKRYLQYKVTLTTSDGLNTPSFEDIQLIYNKPVVKVEVSIDGEQTWKTAAGTSHWTVELVLPENRTTVRVRATDAAGDTNTTSHQVDVDTTPPVGSVKINDKAAFTIDREVTLKLNATDRYGVASMMVSEDPDFPDGTWEDYAATTTLTLSDGDGSKTVYVKYKDNTGLESTAYSATILLDTLPPIGSVVIDGGATYTRNATVTLALNATDPIGVTSMMVSALPDMSDGQWVDFTTTKQLAIAPGNGERTAYVKFRDKGDHVSQVLSDTIMEDQQAPEVSVAINGGAAYTRTADVSITLTATENYILDGMQVGPGGATSITGLPWAPFQAQFTLSLPAGEGPKTVSARLRDAAGNVGATNSSSILLDYTAPKTTMGALGESSPKAKLDVTWSAADAGSGVLWYDVQYKAGTGSWKDLLTHTNQTGTTFTGDDLETYSFRARAQDRAGNLEDFPATVDNAMTVNLPEPVVSIIKPKERAELAGKSTVTGTCQLVANGRNVTKVEWRADNGTWEAADGTLNWSFSMDTNQLKDGKHTLQVRTYDGKHYSTAVERPFSVKNAKAKGFLGADGALLTLGCIAIGLVMFVRRRK